MIDRKTITCRYVDEQKTLSEYRMFGWTVSNKILLNRFGVPLSPHEYVSEDDKREKCSWELQLIRDIDESKLYKLNQLQNEYESIYFEDNSFGKGRITGAVWLSIFSIACYITGGYWLGTPGIALAIALFFIGFFIFGIPIIIIFITGSARVARINNENEERAKKRKEIASEAQKLLKQ